jgi:DNA polymerase-3 subunit delta'
MAFHDIVGNGRAKTVLQLALGRGRLSNSILLAGPRGVGKRATARTLAKALNCLQKTDDSCDECPACRAIDAGRFPDVLDIDPDKTLKREAEPEDGPDFEPEGVGASDEADDEDDAPEGPALASLNAAAPRRIIKITEARLMKQLAYAKPMAGRKKVFILDASETILAATWDTLLKVLEEPPSFTHFILISEKPDLLPPTVRSRCQTLAFLPLAAAEIERVLLDREVEAEQARIIARVVRGDLDQAMDMKWEDVRGERRAAWDQLRPLIAADHPAAFLRGSGGQRGRSARADFGRMLEHWLSFCRDLILLGEGGEPRLLFNPDYEVEFREAAAGPGLDRARTCARLVDEARTDLLERHANARLQASALYSRMLG